MPKCKKCNSQITKFDKEICPYCGCKNPLEEALDQTLDITQAIDTIKLENEDVKYKQKSKMTNLILTIFLGFFGIDSFYLGFIKIGLIKILINSIFYVAMALTLYFNFYNLILTILVPLGFIYLVYIIIGIIEYFNNSKKDKRGVLLK